MYILRVIKTNLVTTEIRSYKKNDDKRNTLPDSWPNSIIHGPWPLCFNSFYREGSNPLSFPLHLRYRFLVVRYYWHNLWYLFGTLPLLDCRGPRRRLPRPSSQTRPTGHRGSWGECHVSGEGDFRLSCVKVTVDWMECTRVHKSQLKKNRGVDLVLDHSRFYEYKTMGTIVKCISFYGVF